MARVLVIDSDQRIRAFIAGILSDFGHQVHLSDSPGEALRLLRRADFDVVVSDRADAVAPLPQSLPALTLSGRCFRSALGRRELPARLCDKPFRLAELRRLTAAVAACEPARALAA